MRRKVEIRVASKDRQARRPFFLEAANSSTLLRTTCTVPVAAASSRRSQLLLLLFIFIRALLARDPQAPRQDGRAGARSDPLRERHGAHVQDPKSTPAPSLLAWPGLAWPGLARTGSCREKTRRLSLSDLALTSRPQLALPSPPGPVDALCAVPMGRHRRRPAPLLPAHLFCSGMVYRFVCLSPLPVRP